MTSTHEYLFDGRVKQCTRCKSTSLSVRSTRDDGTPPPTNHVWCCADCGKTGYIRDLPLVKKEEPKKHSVSGKMALTSMLLAASSMGAIDEPTVESLVEGQMKGRRRR
jgi:hypothetical protein